MGGLFPCAKQRIYSSYKCSKSKGFIALINALGKPDPLQIQVTVDGTTSFAAHSLYRTMLCLSLLFFYYIKWSTQTTGCEVKITVFILCFPEIIHVKNYLDDFGDALLFTGLCSDNLYRTFRPSPLFFPPRPPWRGAHSCLRGHIGAHLTGGNTRFCRKSSKCRNYALFVG